MLDNIGIALLKEEREGRRWAGYFLGILDFCPHDGTIVSAGLA